MTKNHLSITMSPPLCGTILLTGAKNATLPILASLLLTSGTSTLTNVPNSADVFCMLKLFRGLGAQIDHDTAHNTVTIDTSNVKHCQVNPDIMNKMRASILVMGPLLARFNKAHVALPGGCLIGTRPINYHLKGFTNMGVRFEKSENFLHATSDGVPKQSSRRIIFEYPSVGATENIMMFAALTPGTTTIVNAALEPEVLDLICVLKKMGATIECNPGAQVTITGVSTLTPVEHEIIPDRLEAGALLLATAMTKGTIHLPNAQPNHLDLFLEKLREMGHTIHTEHGIELKASSTPRAVDFKTGPYPGFPTDLQAPMMTVQTLANGISHIEETVFENRFLHIHELQKMGAQITIQGSRATVHGVDTLYGCEVIATDIRASCALVIAGLAAQETTKIIGTHHWYRGYDKLEQKLQTLGALIAGEQDEPEKNNLHSTSGRPDATTQRVSSSR